MTRPDFLIIPYIVKENPKLRPTDWIVYAVVYWYEHMRNERCTAGNPQIAAVAGVDDRTVRASLQRLEKSGCVKRLYFDDEKTKRAEIKCMVRYMLAPDDNIDQMSIPGMPAIRMETPGEFSRRFFNRDFNAHKDIIEGITLKHPTVDPEYLSREMGKFVAYWNEPNKSGTKVRWEMQPTFDVKLRMHTWIARKTVETPRAGARKPIIA